MEKNEKIVFVVNSIVWFCIGGTVINFLHNYVSTKGKRVGGTIEKATNGSVCFSAK